MVTIFRMFLMNIKMEMAGALYKDPGRLAAVIELP